MRVPSTTTAAVLGHLLGREQKDRQSPGDRRRDRLDGPRDSGLGHIQLFADHRLHNVVTHVDQRRLQGPPQPQARRIPLDTLLAQTCEQIRELADGQSRGILHDDGPFLVRSWNLFQHPLDLMRTDYHDIASRKCTKMPTE